MVNIVLPGKILYKKISFRNLDKKILNKIEALQFL